MNILRQITSRKETNYYVVILAGWTGRAISAIVQLAITRILIVYLGVNGYSLWVVLASLMGWMALLELGIGPAFQNYISHSRVERLQYDNRISEVFAILLAILFINLPIVLIVTDIIIRFFLTPEYCHIKNLRPLVFIVLYMFSLKAESEVIYRVYFAEHKGYISHLGPATAAVLGFVFLVCVQYFSPRANLLPAAVSFYLPYILVPLFLYLRKIKLSAFRLDINFALSLINAGKNFLAFNFLAASTLLVDYLVMTKFLTPEDIVRYSVVFRVFNLILVFYWSVLFSLWPVSAEYIKTKRFHELNRHIRLSLAVSIPVALFMTAGIVLLKKPIFNILTGGLLQIDSLLIVLFGVYIVIRIWSDTYAMIIQSSNYMRLFLVAILLQSVITITSEIFMAKHFGVYGIVLGLITGFISTVGWFLPYCYFRITKGLSL